MQGKGVPLVNFNHSAVFRRPEAGLLTNGVHVEVEAEPAALLLALQIDVGRVHLDAVDIICVLIAQILSFQAAQEFAMHLIQLGQEIERDIHERLEALPLLPQLVQVALYLRNLERLFVKSLLEKYLPRVKYPENWLLLLQLVIR